MSENKRPITIIHKKRASQLNSFHNLQVGKLGATDVDGLIEYKDKAYLFIEVKYKDKEMDFGQRLALQRLVNDTSKNKLSVAVVCEHYVVNTNVLVDVGNCKVREFIIGGGEGWRPPKYRITVRDMYDWIRETVEKEKTK